MTRCQHCLVGLPPGHTIPVVMGRTGMKLDLPTRFCSRYCLVAHAMEHGEIHTWDLAMWNLVLPPRAVAA